MMRTKVFALLLLVVFALPFPAIAQDSGELQCSDAEITSALDQALADLEAAKALSGSDALAAIIQVQADLNALNTSCKTVAEIGTHSNPVPMGMWVPFADRGMLRIVEITDPYKVLDGNRYVAIRIEYECDLSDPNASCSGDDFWIDALFNENGQALDSSGIIITGERGISAEEAFSGNTLSGVLYEDVRDGEQGPQPVIQVRINSTYLWQLEPLYFSLSE